MMIRINSRQHKPNGGQTTARREEKVSPGPGMKGGGSGSNGGSLCLSILCLLKLQVSEATVPQLSRREGV
jgi:hypothetical protein